MHSHCHDNTQNLFNTIYLGIMNVSNISLHYAQALKTYRCSPSTQYTLTWNIFNNIAQTY